MRTSRGMNRALLFSNAILLAEWEANAPLREAMAIKRERLRALARTCHGLIIVFPDPSG